MNVVGRELESMLKNVKEREDFMTFHNLLSYLEHEVKSLAILSSGSVLLRDDEAKQYSREFGSTLNISWPLLCKYNSPALQALHGI